ncbi:protease PrsW [Dysgonomonas sp. 216]|uniref:PrsW family glutamic-type intramembrane protease n=1 Tax=Dysgonomonas sp. 216 TaxID=2302934 RepID=UPI0013D3AB30|nr:PrsW family glutamic-type intramembrane protease [Dysgonomonas sp. 216]NDW17351.1 protease PrsW [Dysgonomonas sp. 216]
MVQYIYLLFVSLLPVVLILVFVYKKDKYEQEPLPLLLTAFGLGALTAPVLLIVYKGLEAVGLGITVDDPVLSSFYTAFVQAAIPEEFVKFAVLYLLIWNSAEFNERFDGIIYSVFVSLGFAAVENVLYVLNGGVGVGIGRALLSVPGHALFGVAMGYYFSYARFVPEHKNKYLWLSFGVAVLLHGVYDVILFLMSNLSDTHLEAIPLLFLMFAGFVVFLWFQGFKKIKKLSSDFYFSGIPESEVKEYRRKTRSIIRIMPAQRVHNFAVNWYDVTPQLLEAEKAVIEEVFPDAVYMKENGIVSFVVNINSATPWTIQLVYARNYRVMPEMLRVYVLFPDLNDLIKISGSLPYTMVDSAGCYFLNVSWKGKTSGAQTLQNAVRWISLFEKWVNGEIDIEEFKI